MPKGKTHIYTEEEKLFLSENCQRARRELTVLFNHRFGTDIGEKAIAGTCKRYGFFSGRTGHFEKGSKPWNTGIKGATTSNSGSFQKGQVPKNLKPIGHERFCAKDGHILIKVNEPNPYTGASTRYRPKHHVVWEQHNGVIPRGHIIRFKDGDNRNCDIDNLVCVSKSVNLRMNKRDVNNLPDELKETGRMIAELEVAMFEASKSKRMN
ncbi:HNH endonuclease signature motif containing protein [Vibrio spartinae]|uniref:HNH nuclease domain-containing protein n=1 Tax=Vibrio spartinae TaxID=1918945 RepID=A0A1N6M5P9_9VIBR|nr:HNH endonuclease signature motif containing protein [Vibrio spartinae]SIO94687.1 hypothetical protein VSP9026_02416 [Vibrio spartinae]